MAAKGMAPAFQFYADHWLADENTRLMSLEQKGAYIDAMAYCWREGSIPADPAALARLIGCGCTIELATDVQRMFNVRSTDVEPKNDCPLNRLQHKRLNAEREKQRIRSEQASRAGKNSGSARNKTKAPRKTNGRSNSVQRPLNTTSTSSDVDEGCDFNASVDVFVGIPEQLRTVPFLDAWHSWLTYRKETKKSVTDRAAQMSLKRLAAIGVERAIKAIEHSIANDYQGVYEANQNGKSEVDLFASLHRAGAEREKHANGS